MGDIRSSSSSSLRYKHARALFGSEVFDRMQSSKVLVVGAGGIGCELLKDLVMTGFEDITIIDLDTIDVSNLNRQFLFKKIHVGQPKSKVAAESALVFNPHAKINALHGNIKQPEYGVDFFSSFALVMNALDNLDARRHVNRMCLAADVPLIESGTAGYLGQCQSIIKDKFPCYECTVKPTPKVFAYCTIRSNPSTLVHCVIWAKELFARVFGQKKQQAQKKQEEKEAKEAQEPDEADQDDGDILEVGKKSSGASSSASGSSEGTTANGSLLFSKLFAANVESLLELKKNKMDIFVHGPPTVLLLDSIIGSPDASSAEAAEEQSASAKKLPDQKLWTVKQNAQKFITAVDRLAERLKEVGADVGLEFDKDDDDALDFVTSAANLRAENFHIPRQSRFEVKSLAGNIIPAIASTNAIVGGLIVLEAVKILQGQFDRCRYTLCNVVPTNSRVDKLRKKAFLLPGLPGKPNPSCAVCASGFLGVKLDVHKTKFKYFLEEVLKKGLGLDPSNLQVMKGYSILYDEVDMDPEVVEKRRQGSVESVGIAGGDVIRVDDMVYNKEWKLVISHCPDMEGHEIKGSITAEAEAEPEVAPPAVAAPTPMDESSSRKRGRDEAPATVSTVIDDDEVVESEGFQTKPVAASAPVASAKRAKVEEAPAPAASAQTGGKEDPVDIDD